MSSKDDSKKEPEKLSVDDYLQRQGLDADSLGIAKIIRGEIFSKAEERSRLRITEAEAKLQRRISFLRFLIKEGLVNFVGLGIVAALAFVSFSILLEGNASPGDKEWAQTTLLAILSAIAGFVFGKSSK